MLDLNFLVPAAYRCVETNAWYLAMVRQCIRIPV